MSLATLFAISDGMTYGWTAPYIPYLLSEKSHIKTTPREAEWLETVLLLGAFSGLPVTIYLVNKIGRKKSLLLVSFVVLLTWIVIALANRIEYILAARYFNGMCSNMAYVAAPMYVSEIADPKIRGFLASVIYIMMLFGLLIVYCVGPYLPFYVSPIIGGTVAALELTTFSFIPESPYYLCKKNRLEDAKKSLEYFKPHSDIQKEITDICDNITKQKEDKGKMKDLLVGIHRKVILIMIVLSAGQQLCAYSVIIMNLHLILESAGSIYMESSTAAILYAALMLVSAVIASFKLDEYGRKALLLFSSVLTGICLLTMALYFNLKLNGVDVLRLSWIPIVSVMVYASVFKAGVGLVPIVIRAEIFPPELKSIGMTLTDCIFIIGGIVALQIYQRLSVYGIYTPFYIFALCAFAVAIFTIFLIPETKGKSLDEIQLMLQGNGSVTDEKV